jgi:hypothetical protein
MNLFHSPWLRQPPAPAGRFTSPDGRRRRAGRRARLAAQARCHVGAPALDAVSDDAALAGTQRLGAGSR